MGYRIDVDISDANREVKRVRDLPDQRGALLLDGGLTAIFQSTQAQVHVITGSLAASGDFNSTLKKAVWRGKISYGGRSPSARFSGESVHNPVKYAEYEQRRGADHDFMEPFIAEEHIFGEIVLDILRGVA